MLRKYGGREFRQQLLPAFEAFQANVGEGHAPKIQKMHQKTVPFCLQKWTNSEGSQPRFQDVGLFLVFAGPWDSGTLESLGPRSQGPTDPGSRKGHNNPSPTRRPKMAPDVRLGSIFPQELFTDLFFSDFFGLRGRLGHRRFGPFLDTSKDFAKRTTSLKSKPWL